MCVCVLCLVYNLYLSIALSHAIPVYLRYQLIELVKCNFTGRIFDVYVAPFYLMIIVCTSWALNT